MNLPLSLLDNDKQRCTEDDSTAYIGEILSSESFAEQKSLLTIAIGKDKNGDIVLGDLVTLPHLLIAGASGTGKSICIHTMIISLLYKATPSDVKLLIIDPKAAEMSQYDCIPYLLVPVVTDSQKAMSAMRWVVAETMNRFNIFSKHSVRDIIGYNALAEKHNAFAPMPRIVVIIDEISGILTEEEVILRILQSGRATGIHLVASTYSFKTLPREIRSSFGSKITFAVATTSESKAILGYAGAEKLSGYGEAIYKPFGEEPILVKSCFIDTEIDRVIAYVKENIYVKESITDEDEIKDDKNLDNNQQFEDELLPEAVELFMATGSASTSMLQRRYRVGYSRGAKLVDTMEQMGIVSGFDGTNKPRKILIDREQYEQIFGRPPNIPNIET